MSEDEKSQLLKLVDRMTDKDTKALLRFAQSCAVENPRSQEHLRLVVGGNQTS
jgi:hypothetical protein